MAELAYNEPTIGRVAPGASAASWFALQVKTTHEKRVASLLDHKGYEHFLPLYTEKRRWSDRIKEVELPLFPGYIFCRFEQNSCLGILKTPGVYRIVGVGNMPAAIDEQEIAAIQLALSSGLGVQPHPYLTTGQRVRIDGGSFCGVEGLIVDIRRRDRLILSVTLLQRSLALEIDSAWVTPISATY
jgi:transcription antitermination factor NusG